MSIGKALRIMKHRGVGVDYVDDTVIPFVDKKMKPLKGDNKSIAGYLFDKVPGKETLTEDSFFKEETENDGKAKCDESWLKRRRRKKPR